MQTRKKEEPLSQATSRTRRMKIEKESSPTKAVSEARVPAKKSGEEGIHTRSGRKATMPSPSPSPVKENTKIKESPSYGFSVGDSDIKEVFKKY